MYQAEKASLCIPSIDPGAVLLGPANQSAFAVSEFAGDPFLPFCMTELAGFNFPKRRLVELAKRRLVKLQLVDLFRHVPGERHGPTPIRRRAISVANRLNCSLVMRAPRLMRWRRLSAQFGGLAKVNSGSDHAASLCSGLALSGASPG